jgi:hypothetical protein
MTITRGSALIIRALGMLRCGTLTAQALSDDTGTGLDTCRKWLVGMTRVGLCHIAEWVPNAHNHGNRLPVYARGPGQNAQRSCGQKRQRFFGVDSLVAVASVLEALEARCTCLELLEVTGLALRTLRTMLREMQAQKLVRIAAWLDRPDGVGGEPIRQYQQGHAPDEPRPQPKPARVHSKAYYWRQKERQAAPGATLAQVWRAAA